jgi:hypothetical protein
MVHKTDYHREKNHGTLQSVAEQFTWIQNNKIFISPLPSQHI